ncbi:hypothetical protein PPSIR1_00787 [Plesiocystis pacifica SIR-1]|uniref:DUF1579 domain-containing protein n=1 Tax=Plesiocystis pacifica SIR-1 TaxID=391625 RepID=A6GJH7_9BACT|nr:hypothetical protein PPSIR1_00787 [Plesiocystis pacifica SIR-1]
MAKISTNSQTTVCVEELPAGAEEVPAEEVPSPPAEVSSVASAEAVIVEACNAEKRREFDFWAGRWIVHVPDGRLAGHNVITIEQGGCALVERWDSAGGGTGVSTNYWDPRNDQWVQNWISSDGTIIQLAGGLDEAGAMVLVGTIIGPDGSEGKMRGVWTLLEDGRVRQTFEVAKDESDWTLWFEGLYTREP